MRELFKAVAKGEPVSDLGARMYMYGIYLAHGGTPEAYLSMDRDDLDMMYIAYSATEAHRHNRWIEGLIKIIQALFGNKS